MNSGAGGDWVNAEWIDEQIKEFGGDGESTTTISAMDTAAASALAAAEEGSTASASTSTSKGLTKSKKQAQPDTPGGKKRNRSGGSTKTGLTPEAKSRALGAGKTISVKAKKADVNGKQEKAEENKEGMSSPKKKTKVELRVFGEQDGQKANLTRTLWRRVKDEFNRAIAAAGDLALLDGLIKVRHNVSDKKEGKEYGVFVYEEEQQVEKVSELLLKLDLNFDFQMKMVGSAKAKAKAAATAKDKSKAKAAKPTIEMKMLTNKSIPEAELFNVIVKQNKLVGRMMSRSKKDYGDVRVYTITPDSVMMEDIKKRKLETFGFGLDTYAIVINRSKGEEEAMEQN